MENAKWILVKMSSQCKHRGFPSLGQACAYIHSLVSARWPSEALQVNVEKFGEVPDVFEFRTTAADSESERSQACAGLAGRGLRALQEAKQKRQKQCGGPSSFSSEEENSVGASGQAAVGRKILLRPILSFSWSGSLDNSARVFVLVTPQNFGKLGSWLCLKGFGLLQCPCFATPHQLVPFSRSRFSLPALFCVWDLLMGGMTPLVAGRGSSLRVVSHPSLLAVGPARGWAPTPRRRPWVLAVGGPPPLVAGRGSVGVGGPPSAVAGRGSRCSLPPPAVGPAAPWRCRPCGFFVTLGEDSPQFLFAGFW